LALAEAGATVFVNDLDGDVAEVVVKEIAEAGGKAAVDHAELSSVAAGFGLVERAAAAFGRVDVVVNNAGISQRAPIAELDDEMLEAHMGVHLKATVGTTSAAFALMRDGGSIVNTVSGAGLDPQYAGSAAYAAAKGAVFSFTKAAAVEGQGVGIRVNAVSPLAVTRMSEEFFARTDPAASERLAPARVADAVVFLASDLARDVTGRVLRVEGDHVSEAYVAWSEGAYAERWDARALAARLDDVLRRSS
jgi:NAD(P)-dependent dehydrogenase (short-subunit alcohol dehydrogenase family)